MATILVAVLSLFGLVIPGAKSRLASRDSTLMRGPSFGGSRRVRVKVVNVGNLYSAEVKKDGIDPIWQSPRPMPTNELWLALREAGCTTEEIVTAFEGVPRPSSYYHFADDMLPMIEAALAGKREVPPQKPFSEAWIAVSILCEDLSGTTHHLEDILEQADSINIGIPTADEVAWAFLRLRKRGWLSIERGEYRLTPEGCRAIQSIAGDASGFESTERLEEWVLAHPP